MKPETAKALAWPWETEHCWYDTDFGWKRGLWCDAVSPSCKKNVTYYHSPSVEEMLERMPNGIVITKMKDTGRYGVWTGESDFISNESLSEALAHLCIWLRDNNLMKWE